MNITFIGGGNMASAIIGGLLAKAFSAESLRVVDVDAQARGRIEQRYPGVMSYDRASKAIRGEDVVVLAVKPQHLREAVSHLGITRNANLIISIAAGIRTADLSRWQVLKLLLRIAVSGPPADYPGVRQGRCRRVRLQSTTPLIVHTDGEFFCLPQDDVRELEIDLLPAALTVEVLV